VWVPSADGARAEAGDEGLAEPLLAGYHALAWSMAVEGRAALGPLTELLEERLANVAAEGEESRLELLELLSHFVQSIPYSVPAALAGGLRPPVSTLLYRLGDCDSKSLLLALLAQRAGIPAGLFVSFTDGHALAAAAV